MATDNLSCILYGAGDMRMVKCYLYLNMVLFRSPVFLKLFYINFSKLCSGATTHPNTRRKS